MFSALVIFSLIGTAALPEEEMHAVRRQEMVKEQLAARGISDKAVLEVMAKVKRHLFVPESLSRMAYEDRPLPISYGQTISQPYIVAFMTQAAGLGSNDRVLEIGTGSGYQAAVLAEIVKEVYTIEIVKPLADRARNRLKVMGYNNIEVRHGDGYQGWKEQAPFDAIIVTAAPDEIPEELIRQLKTGGRMVIPVGSFFQELYRITKTDSGIKKENLLPVAFVPMIHPQE
ncbi:MAG: protein-L-isoaspartate O-methyltransferase [Candidatus Omnitrophica bacterium CG11_big_fil_rev_8_21_14_0_20_42_13]|uniref:Protein-L-isoaspartate O-methyltransferase n=1 Tax=Candidatus Ghiorseimicrobium undicola TaxID=1974746 RepID=A0A2H0LX72_9BACT|nr:MAG: protein-L-isoaspartate O-methyltransferase [Candidatus Omnitrophica bacterium CG11_big_fil_rev_8_21_14_0_20_42_13]